jgi:translation initiation factor IF-2
MSENIRLVAVAKELNVGLAHLAEHLNKKGFDVESKPTTKISEEMYHVLLKDFREEIVKKELAEQVHIGQIRKETEKPDAPAPAKNDLVERRRVNLEGPKQTGKIDLSRFDKTKKEVEEKPVEKVKEPEPEKIIVKEEKPAPKEVVESPKVEEAELFTTKRVNLGGLKATGEMIDLSKFEKVKKEKPAVVPPPSKEGDAKSATSEDDKKKRKRIPTNKVNPSRGFEPPRGGGGQTYIKASDRKKEPEKITEKDIQEKIKSTLAQISGGKGKSSKAKYKKLKREEAAGAGDDENFDDKNILPVTEFISVSELAGLIDTTPTSIISKCFSLGVVVSINQRLDAELIELVADEFGYKVQFIDISDDDNEDDEDEDPADFVERPPIVTIMGHVDHGKTSLLDYIRTANVVAGEMGGITQHIGAYEVTTESGKLITFLDTPGHEAFTAMRARGAKITDIVVIVIAADDAIMPQTKEAISHAQAAEVPMIFAINKIDKDGANPDKIREQLAAMNILVEDWGGKFQCQEISAKHGLNVDKLLEKILFEAELLDLKGNPNKPAVGSVIEASLDKGKGYVATVMIQDGTLNQGDMVVAGQYFGKIKAMTNEREQRIKTAGPSTPVQILGLSGAPQAGEKVRVYQDEQEAKSIASKRSQILREQGIRANKHITLDEIGRRLALGNFKELNLIIKADFDGSVEALSDSLLKLSTEEIAVNIILKGVGQITESDVLLASASDAIIVAFQVRPSVAARQLAEKESIDIRTYSIIYDAIDEIKSAMEGMLEPTVVEKIVSNVEVREVYKITKIGTIAGCQVLDGTINRNHKVRVIRDGIVLFTGELDSLKRFKDDVKEVQRGMECGIKIKKFDNLEVGDIIEAFELSEVKRTL